jgi:hypothetical protein
MTFDLFFREGVFRIIANLPILEKLAFSAGLRCPLVQRRSTEERKGAGYEITDVPPSDA